jgi:hypothetical protein
MGMKNSTKDTLVFLSFGACGGISTILIGYGFEWFAILLMGLGWYGLYKYLAK